ncbi:hypothetical protein [Parasitella parasitica]|uniref:Uncharacterized protein n=1 Tax=Parasitella parasitica TaxID=35722 RepID=A0A0B7MTN3_9FUNG|nr:hypothetical protein [Parasitella parasitica]
MTDNLNTGNEQPVLYTQEKVFEYFNVSELKNKQPLNEQEKKENYRCTSLPLWTALGSNNTLITSNAINETSANATTKSGRREKRSIDLLLQSLRITLLTQHKWSTPNTKAQKSAVSMEEQLPNYMSSLSQSKVDNYNRKISSTIGRDD